MNNQISVYGGDGFIGSNFLAMYPQKTIKVVSGSYKPPSSEILYLRSTSDNYNVFTDPYLDIHVNLINLVKFLEAVKAQKFVTPPTINFASSWFVYAGVEKLPAKETDFGNPLGFYSATKLCAESLLITYCTLNNLNYRIFRFANVFGKNDKFSAKKNALQFLFNEIRENRDIKLYHGGHFYRDYISVENICQIVDFLMTQAPLNQVYNVGSGVPTEFITLMNFAKEFYQSKSRFVTVEPAEFHKLVQCKDMYLDISKLRLLGWTKEYDVLHDIKKIL